MTETNVTFSRDIEIRFAAIVPATMVVDLGEVLVKTDGRFGYDRLVTKPELNLTVTEACGLIWGLYNPETEYFPPLFSPLRPLFQADLLFLEVAFDTLSKTVPLTVHLDNLADLQEAVSMVHEDVVKHAEHKMFVGAMLTLSSQYLVTCR